VWGEVSAVVNFVYPSANTSVFAKLDVTFGDDSIGGKAGMRVSWSPRVTGRRPETRSHHDLRMTAGRRTVRGPVLSETIGGAI
jgi:hypothetical protein